MRDEDEEWRQRELIEARAAAWAEILANDLEKLEYSLKTPPVDHDSIGKEAHHLYARNQELRLLYEVLESTKQLSAPLLEAKSRHEAAWERVHLLVLQYMDIGAVPDRVREVPRRGAEEQRRLRGTTSEQAESAG